MLLELPSVLRFLISNDKIIDQEVPLFIFLDYNII